MRTASPYKTLCILLGASLMMPAETLAQCSRDPLRPIMRSRVMPPNPGHVNGVTTLEIHLGVDGAPDSAKVVQSTATAAMDNLARRYVMTYWRWQMPTFNCEVKAVSTWVEVVWK